MIPAKKSVRQEIMQLISKSIKYQDSSFPLSVNFHAEFEYIISQFLEEGAPFCEIQNPKIASEIILFLSFFDKVSCNKKKGQKLYSMLSY